MASSTQVTAVFLFIFAGCCWANPGYTPLRPMAYDLDRHTEQFDDAEVAANFPADTRDQDMVANAKAAGAPDETGWLHRLAQERKGCFRWAIRIGLGMFIVALYARTLGEAVEATGDEPSEAAEPGTQRCAASPQAPREWGNSQAPWRKAAAGTSGEAKSNLAKAPWRQAARPAADDEDRAPSEPRKPATHSGSNGLAGAPWRTSPTAGDAESSSDRFSCLAPTTPESKARRTPNTVSVDAEPKPQAQAGSTEAGKLTAATIPARLGPQAGSLLHRRVAPAQRA